MLGLSIFSDCIDSVFLGRVCDTCDGALVQSILAAIIRILAGGVGIFAIIGVLVFGISFLTAGNDVEKARRSRASLINTGIGILIYIVAFSLTEFLFPGGVINHPIASTDETGSCPEVSYTETKITYPESSSSSGKTPTSSSPSGKIGDDTSPKQETPEQPQIKPNCNKKYTLNSSSLKINVCKVSNMYLSYVWVKNANQQFNKQYAKGYPEKGDDTLRRANLGKKIAIAFNISEPVHRGEWYGHWPDKNKLYNHTEPSPIIVANGKTLIRPGEGKNNKSHFMAWINSANQLEYSYQLSKYNTPEKKQGLFDRIQQSGTRNTMIARAVFYINGQKTSMKKWSIGNTANKGRDGGVTLCQLDANNFIVITFIGSTTYGRFQDMISKYKCKTAVSGDGGGSTATYLKKKNSEIIKLESTSRAPAMFYFTEL